MMGVTAGLSYVLGRTLPVLMGFAIFMDLATILILLFYYDTPKYLILQRENEEAAKESVQFYYGEQANADKVSWSGFKGALP